jgi:dihydrofolate reductase
MRKVTLGLANSLDNYIARQDGGADWLHWSKEVAEISAKFMKTVDAILIGRKTYEAMLGYGQLLIPARRIMFSRARRRKAQRLKELWRQKRKATRTSRL